MRKYTPRKKKIKRKAVRIRKPLSQKGSFQTPFSPTESDALPGFHIKRKIASGGHGAVFLAEDINAQRQVALKILHPTKSADTAGVDQFRSEAELLTRFDHPHIVKAFGYRYAKGVHFMIMEFLDGSTVEELLEADSVFTEPKALDIILQVSHALEYLDQEGYVHRDVKPSNMMMGQDGVVKLCDLGFARRVQYDRELRDTTDGSVHYMSPEQAMGKTDVDIRSDIYALGVTLYHLVMGELPFDGAQSEEVMARQVQESLNSSEMKNKGLSHLMHYFIERMMAKDVDLRYADPADLRQDIAEHMEGRSKYNQKS